MLPVRQVLRLGARALRTRHVVACCHVPVLRKPSGFVGVPPCHARLVHEDGGGGGGRAELGKLEGKMKLMFTCKKCNTRTSKLISKLAYNKGVVIVRCDGCHNNHLIADNLGWFSEINNRINIEKLMALKGETVRKIMNDRDGYYDAVLNEDAECEMKSGNECPDKVKMIEESKGS